MSTSLRLLAGGGGMPLTRRHTVPRLRPGDRPVLVDTALTPLQVRQLRSRAHSHRLGVDALVALLLERQSLVELVGEAALERAHTAGQPATPSIAVAAAELQPWQRVLLGLAAPPGDDLPEVHVPLRLAVALARDRRAQAIEAALNLSEAVLEQAVALELAATLRGLTMQTWVLALAARTERR